MNLFKLIGEIFKPAAELIDNVHTSTEEKLLVKSKNLETYAAALEKALDYETEQLQMRAKIIEAEAKSDSFLASNWRPITMLSFLVLVVLDQTGQLAFRLAPEAWTLLQLGLGGYMVGRSAEKIVKTTLNKRGEGE